MSQRLLVIGQVFQVLPSLHLRVVDGLILLLALSFPLSNLLANFAVSQLAFIFVSPSATYGCDHKTFANLATISLIFSSHARIKFIGKLVVPLLIRRISGRYRRLDCSCRRGASFRSSLIVTVLQPQPR